MCVQPSILIDTQRQPTIICVTLSMVRANMATLIALNNKYIHAEFVLIEADVAEGAVREDATLYVNLNSY